MKKSLQLIHKVFMRNVLALVALFVLISLGAQSQVISSKIEEQNGKSYYIHTVEKGQTLYSISKLYQCDVNDITAANPGVDQGIQLGASLRIPVDKSQIKPSVTTSDKKFIIHTVEKKETLYSISRLYQIDINELIAANPGSDNGIDKGQELRIPVKEDAIVTSKKDDKPISETYITHEVKRKETLYSIAKEYNIDINELIAANPGTDGGLKKGDLLRIPQKVVVEKPDPKPNKRIHTVTAGETLYSISRKYGVTTEAIQQANGGLDLGLRINQELIIPGVDPFEEVGKSGTLPNSDVEAAVPVSGSVYKDKYQIGLMLPFYVNYLDTMETRDRMLQEVALQMYRGALMAADTLESEGLRATIYTYDVLDGKSSVTEALEQPEMKDMDVIIGPTFTDAISNVAVWGAQHGVHVVCPVQQPNKVLLNSSNMSKTVASTATQWIAIARHIYKVSPKENIIVIDSKNIDDRRSIDAFCEEWLKLSGDSIRNIVIVDNASDFKVENRYSSYKKNIIIAPTNEKRVISTLFRVLGDGDITVYGTENWDKMDFITVKNRNKYRVHFPQTTFIDYENTAVQRWIESYRKRFKSEPNPYAFLGYDLMMYYGMGLKQYGRDFPNHLNHIEVKNLYAHGFDYIKTSHESGFENQYVMIIGTKDYTLIREN